MIDTLDERSRDAARRAGEPAMPCYLFTFHAYRSWMPDHRRGYTRRGVGYLPPNQGMAGNYSARARTAATLFDVSLQATLVEHLLSLPRHLPLRVHAIATEPSHLHLLTSWAGERTWLSLRTSVKTSLSRVLKDMSTDTDPLQLSRGATRKRVLTRKHFDHLMSTYLPRHSGVRWFEDRGWVDAKRDVRERKTRDA